MKNRISILLALVLLLTVTVTAYAAPTPGNITLISRAGVPFVSQWVGGTGGAVLVTGQPAAWNTALQTADGPRWIWSESPVTGGHGVTGDVVEFTETFTLPKNVTSITFILKISADNEYGVELNGESIGNSGWNAINASTCPRFLDDREYTHYDTITVTDLSKFQEGTNTVVFSVLNLPCYTDGTNPGGLIYDLAINYVYDPVTVVDIDIKPGSFPSCFNNDGNGIIPVAINGSATFDVMTVNAGSVELQGLKVAVKGKSDKLMAAYEDWNGDGYLDLVLKIVDGDNTFQQGSGTAKLTGLLNDGSPFEGTGDICITQP